MVGLFPERYAPGAFFCYGDVLMNGFLSLLKLHGYMLLNGFTENPSDILKPGRVVTSGGALERAMGIYQLADVLQVIAYLSGTVLIIITLVILSFMNYQRYVSDAKQKIVAYLISIGYVSALAFIGDMILTLVIDAFF